MSASERTGREVSMRPPSERRWPASAPVIAFDPPRATGHVSTWAEKRNSMPTAALTGRESGRMECAAHPARSARARSPRNHERPSSDAGSSAGTPKRASTSGWRGRCAGPSTSRTSSRGWRRSGPISRRYAAASAPSAPAVASSEAPSITAGSPSSGWATEAGGWIQMRPCSANGSVEKYGDRIPRGWAAEQTSW